MLYFQIGEETCILRSEIITLVTISNVWISSEGQKECPGGALYCVLGIYRNIWVFFKQEVHRVL